jgi:ribosomal protein L34E
MSDEELGEEQEPEVEFAMFESRSARTAVMRLPSDPGAFRHVVGVWNGHTEELREVRRADGTTRRVRNVVLLEVRIVPDGRCPGCGRPLTA